MSYDRFKVVEKYFKKKENKNPDAYNLARAHIFMIAKEMNEEELKNTKMYYQSQLSSSSMIGNYLTIMAILVSLLACLISLFVSSEGSQHPLTKHFVVFLLVVVSVALQATAILHDPFNVCPIGLQHPNRPRRDCFSQFAI